MWRTDAEVQFVMRPTVAAASLFQMVGTKPPVRHNDVNDQQTRAVGDAVAFAR